MTRWEMKKEVSKKDLREFGLGLGLVLCAVGMMRYLKHPDGMGYVWLYMFGSFSACFAIMVPFMLSPVYKVFLKIAHAIGWVNTRVILVLVYYVLMTPIGLIMRMLGKDLLHKKIDKNVKSYWIKRECVLATVESLEKQF